MRDAGYGRIVNTTSPGMLGSGYGSVYSAVKAGSYGLTRSLAIEGDPFGIRANALAPLAATIAWDVVQAPGKEAMDGPVAQDMSPDLIAPTAALLAHRVCPFSGKNITADPGRVSETYYRQTARPPGTPGRADDRGTQRLTAPGRRSIRRARHRRSRRGGHLGRRPAPGAVGRSGPRMT